jgi:branched-chain amino acid transport system ATP-binding protein
MTEQSRRAVGASDGLQVQRLAVTYGQHHALKGVDLLVAPREIVVILGANGAGKTSLLKAVAGLIAADDGSQVRLDGHALTGLPPHRIVEAGLALVPEGRGIFGDLSVHDNLALGAFAHRARAEAADNLQRVFSLFGNINRARGQNRCHPRDGSVGGVVCQARRP